MSGSSRARAVACGLLLTVLATSALPVGAQRVDGLRAGFSPHAHVRLASSRDDCHLSRGASAAIGGVSGAVAGYAIGWLVWAGSGGVLSSDTHDARRSSARFARVGALTLGTGGAIWYAIHPLALPARFCPADVTFRASPREDGATGPSRRWLGVPTT